jgi:hypothetical protein
VIKGLGLVLQRLLLVFEGPCLDNVSALWAAERAQGQAFRQPLHDWEGPARAAIGEGRAMRSLFDFSSIRWLCSLLAIGTSILLHQPAGHAQSSRAAKMGMPRPQPSRTLAMPPLSPNSFVNLALIPMLSARVMAQPMQAGRMSPYGSSGPYAGPGGYGGSQGYKQGYQGSAEVTTPAFQGYTADTQSSPEESSLVSLLTANGVPNDNGRLRWPLGLRILAAPETDELRERIDALFREAASQAAGGSVSQPLIEKMGQAVGKFRRLLLKDKTERLGMPLSVYNESERFLNQLDRAAQ